MLPARTLLNPPPVGDLLAELAAFGERVARLLADTTADWSRQPAAGEWSLTEIACHLRDVEREVHQARFIALLEDDSAFLPGVDADEWAVTRNYRAQDGRAAAAAFVTARAETLARLAPLPLDAVSYTHLDVYKRQVVAGGVVADGNDVGLQPQFAQPHGRGERVGDDCGQLAFRDAETAHAIPGNFHVGDAPQIVSLWLAVKR